MKTDLEDCKKKRKRKTITKTIQAEKPGNIRKKEEERLSLL